MVEKSFSSADFFHFSGVECVKGGALSLFFAPKYSVTRLHFFFVVPFFAQPFDWKYLRKICEGGIMIKDMP